ncbi:hypothetical protein HR060_09200 [Catenovulum sp. SM1970]|uniref:hypothetical protein n=1 Tax=Marinifaba aquimaris TaxID=2741323 RepID=UPI001572C7DF|nr:hypothetical protein [Marinifaba aquimaris]NTS77048.1 hypothetical protein [Marinifaba aquimaris]
MSTNIKTLTITLLAAFVAISVTIAALAKINNNAENDRLIDKVERQSDLLKQKEQELKRLRQLVSSLSNADNNSVVKVPNSLQTRVSATQLGTSQSPSNISDKLKDEVQETTSLVEIERAKLKIEQFRNWSKQFENENGDGVIKQLNETFEKENIDTDWAFNQQNSLEQLFQQNQYLSNLTYNQIECKSSQCKLTISTADDEQLALAAQSLNMALKNNQQALAETHFIAMPDRKNKSTTIYLARDKKGLTFGNSIFE